MCQKCARKLDRNVEISAGNLRRNVDWTFDWKPLGICSEIQVSCPSEVAPPLPPNGRAKCQAAQRGHSLATGDHWQSLAITGNRWQSKGRPGGSGSLHRRTGKIMGRDNLFCSLVIICGRQLADRPIGNEQWPSASEIVARKEVVCS